METVYDGITITYDESASRFRFTLYGRERSSETLTKAKEAIDKPEPSEKEKFTPIEVYFVGWSGTDTPQKSKITSIAEEGFSLSQHVWCVRGKDKRSKESIDYFRAITPENDAKFAEMAKLKKESDALDAKLKKIAATLEGITLPGTK